MEIEILRGFERILIVVFGGISIVLGWNLFKIGVVKESSATFAGKGYKVVIQKAGPGLFFSLFGTVVLVVALIFGLKKYGSDSSTTPKEKKPNIIYYQNGNKEKLKEIAFSINTLELVDLKVIPYKSNQLAYEKAVAELKNYRDFLVNSTFTEAEVEAYKKCNRKRNTECIKEKSFKEIESWRTEDLMR